MMSPTHTHTHSLRLYYIEYFSDITYPLGTGRLSLSLAETQRRDARP